MTSEITEDEYYATFKPIPSPDKSDYWDWDDIIKGGIDVSRIWTVVEAEDEDLYEVITNGVHHVNKITHMVTETPWEEDCSVLIMRP
jgi:hypothetical protein